MRINSIIVGGGELKEKDRRVTCMLALLREKKALSLKFGSARTTAAAAAATAAAALIYLPFIYYQDWFVLREEPGFCFIPSEPEWRPRGFSHQRVTRIPDFRANPLEEWERENEREEADPELLGKSSPSFIFSSAVDKGPLSPNGNQNRHPEN